MTELKITQADRDAGAAMRINYPHVAAFMRVGKYDDHSLVQAFARHRIAAEEGKAELVDLLDEAADDIETTVKNQWGYDERLKRQYDRDMDIVIRIRAALARVRGEG